MKLDSLQRKQERQAFFKTISWERFLVVFLKGMGIYLVRNVIIVIFRNVGVNINLDADDLEGAIAE